MAENGGSNVEEREAQKGLLVPTGRSENREITRQERTCQYIE